MLRLSYYVGFLIWSTMPPELCSPVLFYFAPVFVCSSLYYFFFVCVFYFTSQISFVIFLKPPVIPFSLCSTSNTLFTLSLPVFNGSFLWRVLFFKVSLFLLLIFISSVSLVHRSSEGRKDHVGRLSYVAWRSFVCCVKCAVFSSSFPPPLWSKELSQTWES